jgi:hypothetical protein
MKTWWQGFHVCAYDESDDYLLHEKCHADNDARLLANLRAAAENETDRVSRVLLTRAADCVARVSVKEEVMELSLRPQEQLIACVEEPRRAVAKRKAELSTFAKLERVNTVDAWLEFIEENPRDERLPIAAAKVVSLANLESGEAQYAIDERLVGTYPSALMKLPASRRILLIGPKGARVRDIQLMTEANVAQAIVVARVRGSSEPYKIFDGEELATLKQMGIADDVVAAMLEVTTKLEERHRDDEERRAIRSELEALRLLIEEKKQGGAAASAVMVQTSEGPMDVLASCAKRLGAVKLCEQTPFPLSAVCASTAEESFPCPEN